MLVCKSIFLSIGKQYFCVHVVVARVVGAHADTSHAAAADAATLPIVAATGCVHVVIAHADSTHVVASAVTTLPIVTATGCVCVYVPWYVLYDVLRSM